MHFLRRNRPGDCAARCKKTNDNLRNSKSFDLNGCDPQNLRLYPDAEQGGEKRCSFDSFESWNWTKSKQFCGNNFPTNKVNPFYSFVLLKFYLFSSQTSWPTKCNDHFEIIMILSYISSSCIFTHDCNWWNEWWLGCPSLTCFFENKKVQPISVVFGGWFEVSQKDFWFGQVSGGAQGRQKSD